MTRVVFANWGWQHAARNHPTIQGFNLTLEPGERVAILGPSGAGKSTILQGLAGVLGGGEDGTELGSLTLNGVSRGEVLGAVGLVLQDPEAQVMLARVGDDVAFGAENLGVERNEIWSRVAQALDAVGLDVGLAHNTSHLSGGQQQRMALAGVLAMRPGVLALDEPTANLDPVGAKALVQAIEHHLSTHNTSLVLVDHNIAQWVPLLTQVIVLDTKGNVVAHGQPDEVFRDHRPALSESGVWIPGDPAPAKRGIGQAHVIEESAHLSPSHSTARPVLLEARDVQVGYPENAVVSGVSFGIRAGQVTAITGPNGVGKTTLALALAGLLPVLGGQVVASDELCEGLETPNPLEWKSAELAVRISMVFQQPEYQFVARTVREELRTGPRAHAAPDPDAVLEQLGIAALANAHPMSLSGGEKRRLSVATAIVTGAPVVILDEPTFGQDAKSWLGLVDLIEATAQAGRAVVTITHDQYLVNALAATEIHLDATGYVVR
ncbi:ABC transporter ATP-binding protein [Stomatohabitans albus]|uniref:ABC transporter ATP-binding protein n=1 Tax=Stomatohabitans albus TaxID=3110766 RepID=UPI00300D0A55